MISKLAFDTNIWLSFIEGIKFDLLDKISEGIKFNLIEIILPEFVEFEFNKKKDDVIKKTIKNNSNSNLQDLESIVEIILSIFELSTKLKTNEIGINEWLVKGEAPNHNGNNYEDTNILNTLLTLEEGTEFCLVTNDSDYRISKIDYRLHPDIENKFTAINIKINLSTDLDKTIYQLGLFSVKTDKLNTYELYNWKAFKLRVKNKGIFVQLKEATDYYYKELDFIPHSYLCKIYPLKHNNDSQTYFEGTTLKIDNEELFSFFGSALIQHKLRGVRINESYFNSKAEVIEFKQILDKLNSNLVYELSYERKTISILLKQKNSEYTCTCNECLLYRHAIVDLRSNLENEKYENTPKNLLKKSFYYLKLKDYSKAVEITNEILQKTNRDEYEIIYSIAQENRAILENMWFIDKEEKKDLKPKNENENLKKGINSIIGYLKYSKFFDYKFYSLSEDIEKVKNRYKRHHGIGSTFISNIEWKNVIRWAQVYNTVHKNNLFFDYYTNIDRFAKITFKQDIISSKDREVKHYVSSYILKTTLPYLKIDDYKDVFFEFNITELKLSKNQIKDIYTFFESTINSFLQIKSLEENHDYREHYVKILRKVAFLVGYISFSKQKTNELISKIFEIYPENERDGKEVLFDRLIRNRIKYISRKNVITYIDSFYQKEIGYSFNITNIFNLLEHFKTIKLKPNQIEVFFFEDIKGRTGYHRDYVLHRLYRYGDKNIKSRVLQIIQKTLNNINTFDYRIADLFIREKIISNSENYFEAFSKIVVDSFNTKKEVYYENQVNNEIKNLDCLNLYINYVYVNYDTPYNYLKQFSGRSDYYDFLISPDDFDINRFNIHWFYIIYRKSYFALKKIIENNKKITKFFLEEISKSENNNYHKAYVDLMSHIYEDKDYVNKQ